MEEEEEYGDIKPHVIIDNGTGYCKAGLSTDEGPRVIFPECVGYPKYKEAMLGGSNKEFFIGADTEDKRGVLKLNYPMEHGVVNDWDDMEKIWGHVFTNELRIDPVEHNVMLTEAPFNPKESKAKMAEIMFETFNVPSLYIAIQAVLSLYSVGKNTGIVGDMGDGVTHFVPIFDSYSLPHAIIRIDLAGRDLTEYMRFLLTEIGIRFSTTSEKEIIKNIKEKACYIALDYENEEAEPFDYELPDGTHAIVKHQRIKCPEALFKPSLVGKEGLGIAQACYDSIQKCDIDLRVDLYNNIFLTGGTSMFEGLTKRFLNEMISFAPESMRFEMRVNGIRFKNKENKENEENDNDKKKDPIKEAFERKFAVWIGGSILSNISSFESNWITKTEYEENGETVVHRKCF